jgi:hypothetical protein
VRPTLHILTSWGRRAKKIRGTDLLWNDIAARWWKKINIILCGYYGCANRVDGQINLPMLVREDFPDVPAASRQKKSLTKKSRFARGKKRIPILYHPAFFWVFAISFHDWKECSEKCSPSSEHFCMKKVMFKHFSEHFLPFSWVYLIPTYVRQLSPPLCREIHYSTWTPPLIHQWQPHHLKGAHPQFQLQRQVSWAVFLLMAHLIPANTSCMPWPVPHACSVVFCCNAASALMAAWWWQWQLGGSVAGREAAAPRRWQLFFSLAAAVEAPRWGQRWQQHGGSLSSAAAARQQQAAWQWCLQRGVGNGSTVAALAEQWRQPGNGTVTAASTAAVSALQGRQLQLGGGGGGGSSESWPAAEEAWQHGGSSAVVGSAAARRQQWQQQRSGGGGGSAAMAAAWWWHCVGGGGSLAAAVADWQQHGGQRGGSAAAAAAFPQLGGGGGSMAMAAAVAAAR